MKFLLDMMEKSKHLFEPGGRLEKLYPLYEAQDTFMFTPADTTKSAPHARDALDLKRTMIMVIIALIPCVLFGIYNVGHQYNVVNQIDGATVVDHILMGCRYVLPIILVSYVVGGLWEVLFCIVRKHEINEGFLVTGMLFPLTLPPTIPLWQVAVGISFGVIIGKEIFGGTGFNVLNPALTARAFLFFAYPVQITGDTVWTVMKAGATTVEGFTGATPLSVAAIQPVGGDVVGALNDAGITLKSMMMGLEAGSIGETSLIAIAIGAAILVLSGIGSWRIMLACVIGLWAGSELMNALPDGRFKAFVDLPFQYHLMSGGFLFGTVFMATDPVSAACSNAGKWIYGFMIGFLVILIRVANPAYPEGVMLAILFMNVMAPMIDYYVVKHHIKRRSAVARKLAHA